MTNGTDLLQAHLLDEHDWIGANEICRVCRIELTAVVELADLGVVSPARLRSGGVAVSGDRVCRGCGRWVV